LDLRPFPSPVGLRMPPRQCTLRRIYFSDWYESSRREGEESTEKKEYHRECGVDPGNGYCSGSIVISSNREYSGTEASIKDRTRDMSSGSTLRLLARFATFL